MKKIILIVLVSLFLAATSFASPFLVCDPQAGVQFYKITGDPFWTANIPAQADGSLRTDLAGIPSGTHNVQLFACIQDASWGEACSAATPFTFTKPAGPTVPKNIKIAP